MNRLSPVIVLIGFVVISWLAIPKPSETATIDAQRVVESVDTTITPKAEAKPVQQAQNKAQDKPKPKPVRVAYVDGNCESYRPLLAKYNWDVRIAMAVMQAESSCYKGSYNGTANTDGTNDGGLMQVNSIHVDSGIITSEGRFDPESNVRAAYFIYSERTRWDSNGWNAWSTYVNGMYAQYLK